MSNYECCIDCFNLNKKIKQVSKNYDKNYRYACKKNNFTCGWMRKDTEMNSMGCSNWSEIRKVIKAEQTEQLCLF